MMKIFMTGGSGFVGSYLSRDLASRGHEVTILTRRQLTAPLAQSRIRYVVGNPTQEGDWLAEVPEHDWIINLAGASIFTRWTRGHKVEIHDSRIFTTRNLVTALAAGDRRQLLCSTSAVGYYGARGEEPLIEESGPGADFLVQLTQEWEAEALKARDLGIRVVITRFGIIMGRDGGALGQMVPMFKIFLGGNLGSGEQWFSWMHQEDQFRAFVFIQEHPEISGPVNLTSPHPVRNRELTRALGQVLHRPTFMTAPSFMLRLVLGEFGETLLSGQRVLPRRLEEMGFTFNFPTIQEALANLLKD
jgi:uncharacterized protein (TIGR01777 family)